MSITMLVLGIIFLVIGICGLIGSILVSNFSFDSCKIVKFDDIEEKFKRNRALEEFITIYSSFGGVILAGIGFFILLTIFIPVEPLPTAIDVYRNRTELEITSVNGVPTDTVVVWKDELLKNQ